MIETPHITQTEEIVTAQIPLTVPTSEVHEVMGPGIREVYATLAEQGIEPAGPWMTHHRRVPTDTFDFEICVPTKTPVTPAGRVVPGKLRAARVARTVFHGGYQDLGAAWGEFMGWIEANGLKPAADLWEVYLVGPESGDDASAYRTELNRPLED
jgi:effector-binding domain-containing protein